MNSTPAQPAVQLGLEDLGATLTSARISNLDFATPRWRTNFPTRIAVVVAFTV